jgi:hypothetical protein
MLTGKPIATVWRWVDQVCDAVATQLAPAMEVIDWAALCEGNECPIGGTIGYIDGTHFQFATGCQAFYSRKRSYSIHMQAVCDGRGRFFDIAVGSPGSAHDSRVL